MIAKPKVNPYMSLMEIPPGYLNTMGYINCSEVNLLLQDLTCLQCRTVLLEWLYSRSSTKEY